MISCIVIDHAKSIKEDNEGLFRKMFYGDRFEINEHENGMTLIFIHKVEKIKVWQFVLNLEVHQIPVGFGFGAQKKEAKKEALARLKMIFEMNIH